MKSKLCCFFNPTLPLDAALLVVRLLMGYAFIVHGFGKIQTPLSWMGPDSAIPGFLQFLGAFAEFGGGIALILGLLTRFASLGLAITMAVAVYFHAGVMGDPFISPTGGGAFELPAVYFVLALLFMATGAGRYSVDAKITCKSQS